MPLMKLYIYIWTTFVLIFMGKRSSWVSCNFPCLFRWNIYESTHCMRQKPLLFIVETNLSCVPHTQVGV